MMSQTQIFIKIFTLCFCLFSFPQLYAGIQPTDDGFGHEAYVSPIHGEIILEALPNEPPAQITERMPPSIGDNAVWIPGYWSWSSVSNDFIWISGVWRVPPPSKIWISGKWVSTSEGWVWIPGFWNTVSLEMVTYIHDAPPEAIEEDVGPGDSNQFWVSGYWKYLPDEQRYEWIKGKWEQYADNWVFVPAHYTWTEKGYVFIPAYWDRPLEGRGKAYSAIKIDSVSRQGLIFYEPMLLINPSEFIKKLALVYPNYVNLISYYNYNQSNTFIGIAPIWWQWNSWMSLTWRNQWALWWWYTHPGYPQPDWMTEELASRINPPLEKLIKDMRSVKPPLNVTTNGYLSGEEILLMLKKAGVKSPIVAIDSKLISEFASKVKTVSRILYPSGFRDVDVELLLTEQPVKPIKFSTAGLKQHNVNAIGDEKTIKVPLLPIVVPPSTIQETKQETNSQVPNKPIPQTINKAYDWRDRTDMTPQEKPVKPIVPTPSQAPVPQRRAPQPAPHYPPKLIPQRLPSSPQRVYL